MKMPPPIRLGVLILTAALALPAAAHAEVSAIEMRNECRNAIQSKLQNYDISFQHADLEEPGRTKNGQITVWKSWFKHPRTDEVQWFICTHNKADGYYRVRLLRD